MLGNFCVINCYLNNLKYMIFSSSFCRNRIKLSNNLNPDKSPTFCWAWSGAQLLAKAIHSQINPPLECKELAHDVVLNVIGFNILDEVTSRTIQFCNLKDTVSSSSSYFWKTDNCRLRCVRLQFLSSAHICIYFVKFLW